jgi:hypothetical protein
MKPTFRGNPYRFNNRGDHVGWGNKVDVVAAVSLKFEHYVCQIIRIGKISRICLADSVILAVLAAQVTTREENGTRTMRTAQRSFLSQVRAIAADASLRASTANSGCTDRSIYFAHAATADAAFKHSMRLRYPLFKLTAVQ